MLEVIALGEGAIPFLKENAVKGAQCVGAKDPILVLDWNDAALAAASAHNAAFTKDAIHAILAHPPPPLKSPTAIIGRECYLYPSHKSLQGALMQVMRQLPWTRHDHPSHAAVGDIVRSCTEFNIEKPAGKSAVFKLQMHEWCFNI